MVGRVYAIPIEINNDTFYYIGKIERNLQKEHKISLAPICGNKVLEKTLLANKETQPKWEEATILATPHTEYKLDVCEKIMT